MNELTTTIVITALASSGLFAFIQFLITRHDNKKRDSVESRYEALTKELGYLKKDVLRTQLLLLILIKPDEKQEIMTIAENYFNVLHGDWYMTSIFNKWLESEGEAEPEWFDSKK